MQQEKEDRILLQSLELQDEPLAGDRRRRLVEAAGGARNTSLLLKAIAEQMLANAEALGIARNESLASLDIEARPICQPLRSALPS